MADPHATQGGQQGLIIPADTQQKFGDLVALIQISESMNDEERQYWVNILPIMTPDQLQNLRQILESERKQLAAIDEKYSTQIESMGQQELVRQTEEERRQRRQQRQSTESSHTEQERAETDLLLQQIEDQ